MIGRPTTLKCWVESVLPTSLAILSKRLCRGGVASYARGWAADRNETRCVWLADSFAGVPGPDPPNCKADKGFVLARSDGG
jgi:O-methyltransferase